MTIGKDYIVLDLHASKCPKKAPQSVLKAVSDSLDRIYSDGSKRAINDKAGGIASLLSVARCSNGKTYGETYCFPEYNHKYCGVSCVPYERLSYFNGLRAMHGLPPIHEWQDGFLWKMWGTK